jgi:hypothetical protein
VPVLFFIAEAGEKGISARQVFIRLRKPFPDKTFLSRVIRPGERGSDRKQQGKRHGAWQKHSPL